MSSQNINILSYRTGDILDYNKKLEKHREAQRRYREKHREELRLKAREYDSKNRDIRLEYGRKYRQENKDKIKTYYDSNADKIRQRAREWRKDNRERAILRDKEYYETHKDELIPKMVEYTKKWRKDNPDKYRVRNQMRVKSVIDSRTGKCTLCGRKTKTEFHHKEYHVNSPLRDTVELCIDCHKKQHFGDKEVVG